MRDGDGGRSETDGHRGRRAGLFQLLREAEDYSANETRGGRRRLREGWNEFFFTACDRGVGERLNHHDDRSSFNSRDYLGSYGNHLSSVPKGITRAPVQVLHVRIPPSRLVLEQRTQRICVGLPPWCLVLRRYHLLQDSGRLVPMLPLDEVLCGHDDGPFSANTPPLRGWRRDGIDLHVFFSSCSIP